MSEIDEIQKMLANQLAQSPTPATSNSDGPQVPQMKLTPTGPHPDEGKQLEIRGTAENAMLGAVVVTDTGASYYIDGLEEWDPATFGARVVVTGTLSSKKLAPDPTTAPDGSVSHGMMGRASVLTEASWRLESKED